jgi:hypothetical protein
VIFFGFVAQNGLSSELPLPRMDLAYGDGTRCKSQSKKGPDRGVKLVHQAVSGWFQVARQVLSTWNGKKSRCPSVIFRSAGQLPHQS